MAQNSVKAIPLSTFNSADMTDAYQVVNMGGLPNACFFIRINNDSSSAVYISYDGIHDHEFIGNLSAFDFNMQANSLPNAKICMMSAGTQIWVRGIAGIGTISLSGYYV